MMQSRQMRAPISPDDYVLQGLAGTPGSPGYKLHAVQEALGSAIANRAVIARLFVSPFGDNSDGLSPTTAFRTIQRALAAASTDPNVLTLIEIGPHATYYDINTSGDPTWTGNYILQGSHRAWAEIRNTHASAASIMKFTGLIGLEDLCFNLGTGNNGVIITKSGFRVDHLQFLGDSLIGAATALHLDGATTLRFGKVRDVEFLGEGITHMTGILIDNASRNDFYNIIIDAAKTAIQIVNAASDENKFLGIRIGDSGIGFDIDAGNEQHIEDVVFHKNTTDVDDEVGDHVWTNIRSETDITIYPDNFTGVSIAAGSGQAWGNDTEIRSAATATAPFRILGVHVEANASEKFRIRLSHDSGSTHFDDIQEEGVANQQKRESIAAGSSSEHIFNKGTRISGSVKSESGGNAAVVWLEIQNL